MNNQNDSFEFTYSAQQQAEIKNIRDKYAPREEDKMAQLRRLDASVTQKGTTVSLIVGIISCLVMGGGMSMVMAMENLLIPGIIVGGVGLIGVALAYPLYTAIIKRERRKIAPEILRLTDELMK